MFKDFKYTARFESPIISCVKGDESFISEASLNNLKPLLPKDVDFSENIDLIGVAFNAAVINQFNKNDDGIDSETAARIIKNFIHKPTNIEHDKNKVVGHIISAGFSEYNGDNKMISVEEVMDRKDPINISLGAIAYKNNNREFVSLIERSVNPTDSFFQQISTSWEIGFSDFVIAVGSKDLKEAEIITNPNHFKEMRGKLKAYGGAGKLDDGTKIYRLLSGAIYPLGIGYTTKPAADVKGIYSDPSEQQEVVFKDKRDKKKYFDIKNNDLPKKSESCISQSQLHNVKIKKENIMDIEKVLSELKDLLVEKKFSEEAVANMTSTFAEAIKQKDAEYRDSIAQAASEKQAAIEEREALKASLEKLQTEFGEAAQKIAEFEAFKKQEEIIARFNVRMEEIDKTFDLDEQDLEVLTQDLKALDESEEAFASYKNKMAIIWKHKNKEVKASIEKAFQERLDQELEKRLNLSKASEEKKEEKEEGNLEEAIEKAKASESGLPNSNESSSKEPENLREKFAKAFNRENITIS